MNNVCLEWKNINLVPYNNNYYNFIFDCFQDFSARGLFTSDVSIRSKKDFWNIFNNKINTYYHEFMVAIDSSTSNPIGFINSFDYNANDGYLNIAIFITQKYRKTVFTLETGIIFLNYLFSTYPIRKIYCTVFDYNIDSLKFLKKAGFLLEGELKKHKYFNGEYHDMKIFVLYRDMLKEISNKFKYRT